jgi:cyclopropane fatty-acyl-phospholipid synthase-like methyltransferase
MLDAASSTRAERPEDSANAGELAEYLTYTNPGLERRWRGRRVPVSALYEAYFRGDVDIHDLDGLLANRSRLVSYRPTLGHLWWGLTRALPEVAFHTRWYDRRLVRDHYDRGDDFFSFFLDRGMVYSAAFFEDPLATVDEAQAAKLDRVCQKLQLKPGERLLDLGCGWGALTAHAAKHYGADVTGVTLSLNQAHLANLRLESEGLRDRARVLCTDYRDIGGPPFDKIASLEMVEHVGVRHLGLFYRKVGELLADQGLFLLQWTGLRRRLRPEDVLWGLFMNRYIFPGADASLCPSAMLKATERAGFELHGSENVTIHYAFTLRAWRRNWQRNRSAVVEGYGERWFRVWNFFLAWSGTIADKGNGACMQVVLYKNLDGFDRYRWMRPGAEIA